MSKTVRFVTILTLVLVLFPWGRGWGQEKKTHRSKDLAPKYQHFLDLTYWIMTDREREVFLRLDTDQQRDRFMELFWSVRDPTPGTERNEYKEEIEERFAYANRRFRFGGVPGWKTDRGRVWIVLGQPRSTERFDMHLELYPIEVWYYYGEGRPNLPSHFAVMFYKPLGSGDYKLYSPVADGPWALFIHREQLDPFNYEALYDKIREIEPTLAPIILSPIPGEIPFNFQPSPESELILTRIIESPRWDFDDTYAIKFERYAGLIELEEANRFIQARFHHRIQWWPDLGYPVIQVEVQPESVSIGQYEDTYYTIYELVMRFEDADTGQLIAQKTKRFEIQNLTKADLNRIRAGLLFQDALPLLPGTYDARILIKNPVSKEFSFWDGRIVVPELHKPYMDPPIVAFDVQPGNPAVYTPYQLGLYRYLTDLKDVFTRSDKMIVASRIYLEKPEPIPLVRLRVLTDEPTTEARELWREEIAPTPSTVPNAMDWSIEVPLRQLRTGRYRLEVEAYVGNELVRSWRRKFSISAARAVPHPMIYASSLPRANVFVWNFFAGDQAARKGMWPEATVWLKRSISQRPNYFQGVQRLLDVYLSAGQFDQARQLLAQVRNGPADLIRMYQLMVNNGDRANCDTVLPQYIEFYNKGMRHWRLLREIGLCFWNKNQKEKARTFLQDSLNVNPNQNDIKALLQETRATSKRRKP